MSKTLELPDVAQLASRTHGFVDDFDQYVSGDRWTLLASDLGTATLGDAVGGRLTLAASDGTAADNDESYLHTTQEIFLFADDKPIDIRARIQFTEANTDDANVLFGLMNAIAANHLQDDGAGPAADYSGAVFFKEDGQTVWTTEVSDSTTQTTKQLTAANSLDGVAQTAGGAAFQELRIIAKTKAGSLADVIFMIDDVVVNKVTDYDYSNATEMAVVFGIKNGGANAETLVIDLATAHQLR